MRFLATPGRGLLVVVPAPAPLRALPPLPPGSVALCVAPLVPAPGLPGLWWVCQRVGWGGVGFEAGSSPIPCCFPLGGRCLHSPSECNAVVLAVDLYPPRTKGPASQPGTPAVPHTGPGYTFGRKGVLAGQARLLLAPMDSVPYPQPLTGQEPQYVPWGGLLVRPTRHSLGRCHLGPLTNGPRRIPPYGVCSGGAKRVTGGAPKPLRLGPSPASPVGSFRPVPPLPLCWRR